MVVSIDLAATYYKASGFSLGFGLPRLNALSLTSPTSRSLTIDAPLKIEINDWFSVYAGLSGSTSSAGSGPWTSFKIDNWKTGFSADVIQQQGWLPTVTATGSVTRPFDRSALIQTTTWTGGVDLDFAVDAEQTRGLLAGVGYMRVTLDQGPGTIQPATMFYGGVYRQFGEWKLSGRAGMQFFRGAEIRNLIQAKLVDIPFIKADLERLDEDDNRLLGLSFGIGWSPQPSVQLILNLPIYISR